MLFKKMLRDISDYKFQFISIFLLAFLGVFLFSGINAEEMGLESSIDNYYDETNIADGWIYSPYLNELFLEQVYMLGPTTQMERQLVLDSLAELDDNPDITLHFVENNTMSKFYLIEGENLNINDSDGVWLDKDFADARNLAVGDNITFNCEGIQIEKEIRGLGYSPEYVFNLPSHLIKQNFSTHGFAYMSHKAFPSDSVPYNVLNVKFEGNPETYDKLLEYRLDGYYNSFLQKSEHPSVSEFDNEISQHKMAADIFPFVFILVSLLILLSTIKRMISHQRTQIGILKANGFGNGAIIIHYLSYGVLTVSVASILALILGPIILPKISYVAVYDTYRLPYLNPAGFMNFIHIVVISILMSILVSYFAIKNIIHEPPSSMIRPDVPKASTSTFVERFRIWNSVPFNIRWNYRDSKRHKFRALMTFLGVVGCTALLISAFGLNDGINDSQDWYFNEINHFESKLVIDKDVGLSQIDNVARKVNGDKLMESYIDMESANAKTSGTLLVLNETDLITPTDDNHEKIKINDEDISVSKKIADSLDIRVGDTLKWHIKGSDNWVNVKIDKIHADPSSQGLIISASKLDELGLNFTPTSIITSEHVDGEYDGIKAVNSLEDMKDNWNELYQSVLILVSILMFFAIVLAVVVTYNLLALTFLEMEYDITILKILGFSNWAVTKLLAIQSLFFISLGILLGIPLGYYIQTIMWASSSKRFYQVATLSSANLISTCIIIFAVSIIVIFIFFYKIKKLDIVEESKILE